MLWIVISIIAIVTIASLPIMVTKGDHLIVLWPEYFDKNLTKNQGRRIPLKLATGSPTVEDIAKAAKRLKLLPKIESNKAYPNQWWRKSGRVLVKGKAKKTKIIRQVAIVLKKYKK
jgi:signal recognition particle subunit SRP19